jgi:hypothetical protein
MPTQAQSLTLGLALLSAISFIEPAQSRDYVRFVDPREGAFSAEVPQDWNVQGGLLRYSPLAYNFVLQLDSPNGQHIKIGDANILPFTAPGPGLPPPGSKYPVGQGVVMIVAPYLNGVQFAQKWGGSVLSQACGGRVQLRGSSPVPSPSGARTDHSGQAIFACGDNIAYVFATTRLKPGPTTQWEAADAVIGLAPPDQIRHTVDVIYHFIGTARINPQWMIAQLQRSGMAINIARQTTESLMRTQEQTSINTPGSASYAIDQVVRGYTTTPGGTEVQVQGQGNYHWNCQGRQVNTQSAMSPGPNCTRIK